ncbi:MFS transporter [Ferroplasma sp.]|uniref:MFS transporter n=1 Tax=Ferroplasma sp. TaxID=2591003 RepID=UPI002611D328|nr:MFS transporter [Ferroplasma sp.]
MDPTAEDLLYRLDSMKQRPYGRAVIALVAISFFLVFWDVYNIGFILPVAATQLGVSISSPLYALPITTGLIGYVFGELGLGYYAQSIGRKNTLLITLAIAAIGSLLAAFSVNFVEISIFRFIIGTSIGGEIGLTSTYISEITPSSIRGTYVGIATAVGMIEIIPVGATAFFIVPTIVWGWRMMFAVGAIVAIPAIIMRFIYMPESPRWLLKVGKKDMAEREIKKMEQYLKKKYGKVERHEVKKISEKVEETNLGVKALFTNRKNASRMSILLAAWFSFYIGDYGLVSVVPTLFIEHGLTISTSYLYFFLSTLGDSVGAFTGMALSDKVERKYLSLGIMILSFIFFSAWGLTNISVLIIIFGFMVFFTQGLWLPVMYAYSNEVFLTEGRSTAMGLTDGMGHIGGAISPYLLIPIALSAGILGIDGYSLAFIFMGITAIIGGLIVGILGPKTKKLRLEEINDGEISGYVGKTTGNR